MPILTLLLPVLSGAIAGAMAGGLLAWWLGRRGRKARRLVDRLPAIDPEVLSDIDHAAKAWADAHGQPLAAAGLVADKLRLVYELTQRRGNS
ncbi:MAG TPA: hypothetical protein VFH99_03105 [Candidatus Saccharimonadales bacterium]|nr:hypothetical protein [Candidatus Saccharimonadales bacterium]